MSKVAITGNASGTGVFTVASPNSNVDRVLTLPDETGTVITTATTLVPSTTNTSITLGTAVATTSGTSIDFTGIPAGVKRVTCMLKRVSINGVAQPQIRLGTSAGVVGTGYQGATTYLGGAPAGYAHSSGFSFSQGGAAEDINGSMTLLLLNPATNLWVMSMTAAWVSQIYSVVGGGNVTLPGGLDRIRLTTSNGTDAFDLGEFNISWEF